MKKVVKQQFTKCFVFFSMTVSLEKYFIVGLLRVGTIGPINVQFMKLHSNYLFVIEVFRLTIGWLQARKLFTSFSNS